MICKANDDDESSMMKNESLDYSWSCAFGDIESPDNDQNAIWVAPDKPAPFIRDVYLTWQAHNFHGHE